MLLGIFLFIVGTLIAIQNTKSRMAWPLIVAGLILIAIPARAHDEDHEHDQWYSELRMPDHPGVPCCGKADAYWCDVIHVKDSKTYCTVTDDRDDGPLNRNHVPVGTEIEIPDAKLTWKWGNPTGHAILFLSHGYQVYCFVQGTGI